MEVAAPEKFAASAVNSHCGEASVGQTGGVWDALAHCTGVQNHLSIKSMKLRLLICSHSMKVAFADTSLQHF